MIALITGPDARSARQAARDLLQRLDSDSLNTTWLDGRSLTVEAAVAAVAAPGFFGTTRVVVVEDLMARATKGGDEDEDGARAAFDFGRLFAAVADGNALVLLDKGIAGVPAAVRRQAPKDAQVSVNEPPRGAALVQWIRGESKAAGGEMTDNVARQLASVMFPQTWTTKPNNPIYDRPPDLEAIANEVAKLVAAAHPDPVEPRHINAMTAAAQEDRLFPFLDALLAGEAGGAANELARLRERGEEPARIVTQVFQQAELLAVLGGAGRGASPADVGREIGLSNPARMGAIERTAGRLRRPARAWVEVAAEVERGTKRGRLRGPWDGLYQLVQESTRRER